MHLIRILESVNPGLVNELDSRYVKLDVFAGMADIHGIQLQTGAYFRSRHHQKVLV